MQVLGFQEAVNLIVKKHPIYRADAYFFLHDALNLALKRRRKNRKGIASSHLTAVELLEGFRLKALQDFGPMTITVLNYWGIKNCESIGQIVFYLIEIGILGKTENDTLESFANIFDFEQEFVLPFQPKKDLPPVKPGLEQLKTK